MQVLLWTNITSLIKLITISISFHYLLISWQVLLWTNITIFIKLITISISSNMSSSILQANTTMLLLLSIQWESLCLRRVIRNRRQPVIIASCTALITSILWYCNIRILKMELSIDTKTKVVQHVEIKSWLIFKQTVTSELMSTELCNHFLLLHALAAKNKVNYYNRGGLHQSWWQPWRKCPYWC